MALDFIAVCADESGIQKSAKYCVLAGYIGTSNQWAKFEKEWERALTRRDVREFHAKDFFAFGPKGNRRGKYVRISNGEKGRYGDWQREDLVAFRDELCAIIDRRNIHPIGAMIDVQAFNALAYGERKFLTGANYDPRYGWTGTGAPSKPYFVLFNHLLWDAAIQTRPPKKLLILMHRQEQYRRRAEMLFSMAARTLGPRLAERYAGLNYVESHHAPGVQAADLYAHCWFRFMNQPHRMGQQRRAAMRVLTRKDNTMKEYDADHLERVLSQATDEFREIMKNEPDPNN